MVVPKEHELVGAFLGDGAGSTEKAEARAVSACAVSAAAGAQARRIPLVVSAKGRGYVQRETTEFAESLYKQLGMPGLGTQCLVSLCQTNGEGLTLLHAIHR